MAYLLPRAVLILVVWAMSCALIRKWWPEADAPIFVGALVCWIFGGIAYFGYLHKLRRDIAALERARGYSVDRSMD
jgi:drug/metabolite transporter (DMT)-like permease